VRLSFKLCTLALTFGLFSVGTIAAAAFLPLEKLGQPRAIAPLLDVHSFHAACLKRPCRFDFVVSPTT
jgi:hypothetical protein